MNSSFVKVNLGITFSNPICGEKKVWKVIPFDGLLIAPMARDTFKLVEAEDGELVEKSLEGDLAAYDEIVRRYQQILAACLFRFCSSHPDLEDLVQETFIRAYRQLHKWKPNAPFKNWIRRVGYNLAYDFLRRQKRNPLALRKSGPEKESESSPGMEMEIMDHSRSGEAFSTGNRDLVDWLLSHLKTDEAMLISMMYLDQLSVREIVDRTGWSESNVKVKSYRTRQKLKKLLVGNEEIRRIYGTLY